MPASQWSTPPHNIASSFPTPSLLNLTYTCLNFAALAGLLLSRMTKGRILRPSFYHLGHVAINSNWAQFGLWNGEYWNLTRVLPKLESFWPCDVDQQTIPSHWDVPLSELFFGVSLSWYPPHNWIFSGGKRRRPKWLSRGPPHWEKICQQTLPWPRAFPV